MVLKSPHILLASSNCRKLLENVRHIIDSTASDAIQHEIDENVRGLFKLGEEHFIFAVATDSRLWRQRISRIYYGAYNVRRAVRLRHDGSYGTDVSDHNKCDLPDGFQNKNTYENQLRVLRDDRNLADYDHTADETDLVIPVIDAQTLVSDFIKDAKIFLTTKGVNV